MFYLAVREEEPLLTLKAGVNKTDLFRNRDVLEINFHFVHFKTKKKRKLYIVMSKYNRQGCL